MKTLTTLSACLLFSLISIAQVTDLSDIADVKNNGNWIRLKAEVQIAPEQFFQAYLPAFGLNESNSFELIRIAEDDLGYEHYRYQQHYAGVPIEGGEYILHAKDGVVLHANGKIVHSLETPVTATLSAEAGIEAAKQHMGAAKYYWEIPEMEQRIKHIKKDLNATFYPSPELVFVHPEYGERGNNYALAWKIDLFTDSPEGRKIIFVDANSGAIVHELDGCQEGSSEGTAETRYHGTQNIVTDSISPTEFRLIDATRGGGIETYDMNEETDHTLAVDFIDDDNYWDNANAELDEAATDAHWGMEMTYDYYLQKHGRDSYDGNGTVILSYIHYDEAWFNARWVGLWAEFGDGSGNPLTAIDVVSHELTHGITGTSAGLIYQGESGALNESFSDIFGTAVEFFAWPSQADWLLGQANFVFRDLSDPNAFGDPDTYQGSNWYNGPNDNGGVHTNSGVQNFWFYLLSEGGLGTNDNGNGYAVDSLGIEKAAAIAYRNLNYYLTQSSNYADARNGALQAAEDLYGTCSYEVLQVGEAWYAVGVGADTIAHDAEVLEALAPMSSCAIGNNEELSFSFRYNRTGCGHSLNAGDTIQVGYQLDNNTPVLEDIVLTNTLNGGDTITHTFQSTVDLSVPDLYRIDYWVALNGDLNADNDEIANHEVRKVVVLNSDEVIAFQDIPQFLDSFYVETRSHSEADFSTAAANTGTWGFQLNGKDATPNNVEVPQNETDIYNLNPDFGSKICICVDASSWSNVRLSFDLQQTFSGFYLIFLGADLPWASSLRVLVNGAQVGGQFHPTTYDSDPFLTMVMNLDQFAGTEFDLCFEGRHFIEEGLLPGDPGDNSYLDNIFLTEMPIVGVNEVVQTDANIYPIPTNGQLMVELNAVGKQQISLVDLSGKEVLQQEWNANEGRLILDLSDLAKGLYTLSIRSEQVNVIRQVILE